MHALIVPVIPVQRGANLLRSDDIKKKDKKMSKDRDKERRL